MARKRATIEERMNKLRADIFDLEDGMSSGVYLSSAATRRTLAGKRAALHVMEGVVARGEAPQYCKEET